MNKKVLKEYRKNRRPIPCGRMVFQESAASALGNARTVVAFERAEWAGLVRLEWVPDMDSCFDDLAGDCFNVENFQNEQKAKDAQDEFIEKINRDGVWGLIGQYRIDPESEEWEDADCCLGFVGTDACGYENDIMNETINALKSALVDRCALCRKLH